MERIKGLSIDLDLNTVKVQRGLTGLKSAVKGMDREMAANMSTFDRSEKSVAKYETQLTGLNKKIEYQTKVVQESEAKYKDMVKTHGEGSKKAMNAAADFNKQAASLNNLKSYTEGVTKEFQTFQKQQAIANSNWTKMGNAFSSAGKGLVSFGSTMGSVGKQLTSAITLPATAAAAALGGIAVAKGWNRLVGIDTAKAKLEALGHSAENVENIMGSALDAVRGTSFGLDEAATTAANAVAAGVKEGEDLTKYLSTTGDAAAIAGSSLSEMGSIFNKVQTSGKAYTGELQMLSDRGLPIYQWLAKEAGVTAEKVSEMASAGEISTDLFLKAVENNIGGAAKVMGEKSFTAGIANMWASVGRLGASFLDAGGEGGGFFSTMKPLIGEMTENLDGLAGYAQTMGEKFGEAFANVVDKVKTGVTWFKNLDTEKKKLVGTLAGLTLAAGPVLMVFGKMATSFGLLFTAISPVFSFIATHGGLLNILRIGFAALTGPIGLTVAAITALTTGFVIAYNKSDTFRNIVDKVKDAFVNAYNKVKEFLTTNPKLLSFVDSVKSGFETVKTKVMDAIGVAMGFVQDKIADVKKFWDAEGSGLLQAFQNIFNGISAVVTPIIDGLVSAFKWAFPYMKTIFSGAFSLVLSIAKSIWGNIQGVIDGGLKIIMGLAQVFSGLFTGNFSKMWEGVKTLFSGAVQFVWNFVQLTFFGKLLGGVKVFIKSFAGFISSMWTGIKNTFSTVVKWVVDFVKNRFTSMQTTLSNITTGISNFFSSSWNWIWNGIIMPVVRSIVDFVRGRFSTMRDTVRNILTTIRDTAKNMFDKVKSNIINPVRDAVSNIRTKFTEMKDKVTGIFTDVKNNVSGYVTDMVDTVKEMPQKMSDGLKSTAGKVGDGLKAVANKMTEQLGKGVNGVIGGVNWVLEKVGVSTTIKEWAVPQYAHGTDGHKGGLAVVGDGKGSNAGQELIETPNGRRYLSPANDTLVDLPKGTHVWSATETREMMDTPHYAWGTIKNFGKSAWGATKNVGSKIKDSALDVWDYISNPGKLFNKALDMLGVKAPSMGGSLKELGVGAYNKAKSSLKDFVINKVNGFFEGGEGGAGQKGKGWGSPFYLSSRFNPARRHPITGRVQPHNGDDWAAPMGTPFFAQAAGKVSYSGWGNGYGNLIKIQSGAYERRYAHNQRNLVKAGQTVKAGQRIGLTGSTGDSTGPHVHYEVRRNGIAINPRGLATGGLVNKRGFYELADGGYPEFVIPTDPARRTDAQKLLAIAGKQIQSGAKRPNQLPNPSSNNSSQSNNSQLEKLLAATLEQNELLKDNNKKLEDGFTALLAKTIDVFLNKEKVGRSVDEESGKRQILDGMGIAY
ncbi:peptidoglycan DD-metalloendopeptidase family protein [Alkalicoccobacillus gibsonii]|uniref:peptidoglycan DD-metalloendopeptidase family protein n=1 Tax=Alkalicoccobacillus gibsonii TaxID=79881 RepID=UPI0019347AE3|nr:peptidoglycan DD-metalloendopeptidase family protein [Alkalicoccobacillus gibsonii]MBM0064785.1 peptidoglycan DD-metalloendopeptidase family protein [Alkalicoccobacillus gibsonii]